MDMVLDIEKSEMDQIFPCHHGSPKLQPYILYESYSALGCNGSTALYNFIKRFYYWKKLHHIYVRSFTEWQQVTQKEPQYVNLHFPIPHFPTSFLSMALLGPYSEMENRNQYTLTL